MENSIKRINNSEIAIKEKEFMKWLGENEETNKIVNKSEVEKAISDLFMSSWSTQSHWFARYCCRQFIKLQLYLKKYLQNLYYIRLTLFQIFKKK